MNELDTESVISSPESSPNDIKLQLYKTLPTWATELITSEQYEDTSDPYREEFAENPNGNKMHSKWHQWGIIRHTLMTGRYLDEVVPELIQDWFPGNEAETMLGLKVELINGFSKWDLMQVAVPTHDYGKFIKRQFRGMDENGQPHFNFAGHEEESGRIVRQLSDRFRSLGMTDAQIEYVARVAELHYELGKMRDVAKKSDSGYTIAFTGTEEFAEMAQALQEAHPDMARELGIFFIADSLAKTDIHLGIKAQSDEQIAGLEGEINEQINHRHLPKHIMQAALQLGVNVMSGRRYLETIKPSVL